MILDSVYYGNEMRGKEKEAETDVTVLGGLLICNGSCWNSGFQAIDVHRMPENKRKCAC